MQPLLQPSVAESLSGIWSALHKDVELMICETEVHYLRTMAVMMDDDSTSHLLLKKLQLAQVVPAGDLSRETVSMNCFLEYAYDCEPRQFCQLVHPSCYAPSYGLPVTSSLGAGLIGLRAGQTILWPNYHGMLCDLTVIHVEKCPGLPGWLESRRSS